MYAAGAGWYNSFVFLFSEEEDEEKEDDYFHSMFYCLRFSLFVTSAS